MVIIIQKEKEKIRISGNYAMQTCSRTVYALPEIDQWQQNHFRFSQTQKMTFQNSKHKIKILSNAARSAFYMIQLIQFNIFISRKLNKKICHAQNFCDRSWFSTMLKIILSYTHITHIAHMYFSSSLWNEYTIRSHLKR